MVTRALGLLRASARFLNLASACLLALVAIVLATSAAQAKPSLVATFPGTDEGSEDASELAADVNASTTLQAALFALGLRTGGEAKVIRISSLPVNGKSVVRRYEVRYNPPLGADPLLATPAPLGNPETNSIFPFGLAISPSDIVSVGASETGTNGPDHAFRYSLVANTTTDLGALGGADAFSFAYGISNDASTIVGASYVSANLAGPIHAFRIGADGVMVDLGSLAGASGNSTAFAANGDGSLVVGQTNVPGGNQHAFLWTLTPGSDTGTMTDLGGNGSFAIAVNFDGSVTVGANTVNIVHGNVHTSALYAALWNGTSSPVDLGVLPGDIASIATGVSADGTVVVGISDPVGLSGQTGTSGYGYNISISHAFVWTQATGMQDLTLLMTQAGALTAGTSLAAALSVSPDGQEIAGAGQLPGTPQDTGSGYVVRYCNGDCPDGSAPLVAVLPASRSIEVGNTATAFATIINPSASTLTGCFITPATALPESFAYQTTDPATNALTGTANTPVSISAGGSQSFVFALTANAAFPPTNVTLGFECTYAGTAGVQVGLNTLMLSASTTPVPDVVALAATTTNDGILHITGASGSAAFAVATVNLGAGSTITVTANTGAASLPLALTLCQTNPQTGQCLAPPAASVTTVIAANATPTFAIFGTASGAIAFDPAGSRIFVQFADANGVERGATSVAVETQ